MSAGRRPAADTAEGNGGRARAENYSYLDVTVGSDDEEIVLSLAWSLGCIGSRQLSGQPTHRLYFPPDRHDERQQARALLAGQGGTIVGAGVVEDRDWLARYRAIAAPIRVGGFLLDPGEEGRCRTESDLRVLRLPARRAFGTGSHASTHLVVEWLDRHPPRDLRVLDVGCGTGVLSFVAALLGAARVVAIDNDREAAIAASENARRNGAMVDIVGGGVEMLASNAAFDLVVANVLPENLTCAERRIASLLAPGGLLALSGVLTERADEIDELWATFGLERLERTERDEWSLLILQRPRR